jgi:iron complex outermembrane receptor protein
MMSMTRQQIHALLYALCVGVGIGLLFTSTPVFAQDEPLDESVDEPVELERFSVTGTRIKKLDAEGSLPVTIIDREMIELSGESSVADFLRSLSFNSFGSYRSQMGTVGQGTSQINLRGLGSNRSLVLIDGRRLPKAPQSTAYQDLNIIPMGAVERIEILSDGASAIYGSDAIGGVVNIITRDNYEGWELMYGRADNEAGGGELQYGNIMFGTSGNDWKVIAVASFNEREVSYLKDYEWSEPTASYFGNNFSTVDPVTGAPFFDLTAIPGGCNDSPAFTLLPDPWSLSGEYCAYDWALIAGNETSVRTMGMLVKAEYDISNNWLLWANVNASRSDTYGRYAPLPSTSLFFNTPIALDSPNNPTNPASAMYDPAFGPNVEVHYWHRFDSLGNRDGDVGTDLKDLQLGVTGWVGKAELDFGIRVTKNHTDDVWQNMLLDEIANAYILDGIYDLQHPRGNPDDVLNAMKTDYFWLTDYDQNELFATVAWDLFEIGGTPVQWIVGGEYREEMYDSEFHTSSSDIELTGADREISSLFFETLLPLTGNLELSLAGRYDDYSDWGDNFSPKISLRWRVTDKIVLRASRGEGFRAPELYIHTVESEEWVGWTDQDPQSCEVLGRPPGCFVVFKDIYTVSPAITAEQSEQYSLGLAWEPSDYFKLTLDYYNITLEEEISEFWPDRILEFEQRGQPLPPGLGVTRDPGTGLLLAITSGWGNLGLVETSGMDLNAQLNFDLGPGYWSSTLQASYVFEYVIDEGIDWVGLPGQPQARATLSNHYNIGDFTFSWNIQYIGDQNDEFVDEELGVVEEHVPNWVTHDLQANYRAFWNGQFTIGAQNVFGKKPPLGGYATWGADYNTWLYNGFGRILYAQYKQIF